MEIFGWFVKGNFYSVDKYEHLTKLDGELLRLAYLTHPNFARLHSEISSIHSDCEYRILTGEHPEWHIYEMAVDEYQSKLIKYLYDGGWIRVGSSDETIYFEGNSSSLYNWYSELKEFAESNGMYCCFEKRS